MIRIYFLTLRIEAMVFKTTGTTVQTLQTLTSLTRMTTGKETNAIQMTIMTASTMLWTTAVWLTQLIGQI